jgi:uncharacterized protein (TIGR03437 family)
MNRELKLLLIPAAFLLMATSQTALAISSGAPEGSSGAPNEGTCTGCHGGVANSGPGRLRIEVGGSGVYVPGEKIRIRIVVEDPVAKRWGFQLTARAESNPDASAGRLETAGNDTQVISSDVLQWITHTAGGTRFGSTSSVTFDFDWTAPDSAAGPVLFYAAANAANGNGSSDGDRIYTSILRIDAVATVERPTFTSEGVTDFSTGQPGIAPGAWVSIAGSNLADQVAYWSPVEGKRLETTVGKVTVKVNGIAAALSFVSPGKITFLSPSGTPDGDVPIIVESDGRVSDAIIVRSAQTLPAVLTTVEPDSDPQRLFATATTVGAGTALSLVSAKGLFLGKPDTDPRAARGAFPGEEIDIYAIGLGKSDPEFPSDRLFNSSFAVTEPPAVQIGGVTVTPSSAVLIAPGVYVVRVKVPESQEPGDVPLVLELNGVRSRNNVFLYVQKQP